MRNLMECKRGIIGEGKSLFFATIAIAFVLVISVIAINALGPRQNPALAEKESSMIQARTSLIAYLLTPVKITKDGSEQEILVSELIQLSRIDKAYLKDLEIVTRETLGRVPNLKYSLKVSGVAAYSGGFPREDAAFDIALPNNLIVTLATG